MKRNVISYVNKAIQSRGRGKINKRQNDLLRGTKLTD